MVNTGGEYWVEVTIDGTAVTLTAPTYPAAIDRTPSAICLCLLKIKSQAN